MTNHNNRKKKLIISYKNLTEEVRELFKEAYPEGYKDYLQKTIKPNGEPIFVVPLETEDTSYMVKFDVVYDTGLVEEDIDKDLYGEDSNDESEFAPISEAIDKEENGTNHAVGKMRHGAIEEFEGLPEDKKEFEMANEDLDDEYGDRPDDDDKDSDSYTDGDSDDDEDDMEPSDEELLDIDALLEEADSGEGMLREDNPPEEKKRGRKRKSHNPDITSVQAVGEAVKEARKNSIKKTAKSDDKKKTAKETKTVKAVASTAKVTDSKKAKAATEKATKKSATKTSEPKQTASKAAKIMATKAGKTVLAKTGKASKVTDNKAAAKAILAKKATAKAAEKLAAKNAKTTKTATTTKSATPKKTKSQR